MITFDELFFGVLAAWAFVGLELAQSLCEWYFELNPLLLPKPEL